MAVKLASFKPVSFRTKFSDIVDEVVDKMLCKVSAEPSMSKYMSEANALLLRRLEIREKHRAKVKSVLAQPYFAAIVRSMAVKRKDSEGCYYYSTRASALGSFFFRDRTYYSGFGMSTLLAGIALVLPPKERGRMSRVLYFAKEPINLMVALPILVPTAFNPRKPPGSYYAAAALIRMGVFALPHIMGLMMLPKVDPELRQRAFKKLSNIVKNSKGAMPSVVRFLIDQFANKKNGKFAARALAENLGAVIKALGGYQKAWDYFARIVKAHDMYPEIQRRAAAILWKIAVKAPGGCHINVAIAALLKSRHPVLRAVWLRVAISQAPHKKLKRKLFTTGLRGRPQLQIVVLRELIKRAIKRDGWEVPHHRYLRLVRRIARSKAKTKDNKMAIIMAQFLLKIVRRRRK